MVDERVRQEVITRLSTAKLLLDRAMRNVEDQDFWLGYDNAADAGGACREAARLLTELKNQEVKRL